MLGRDLLGHGRLIHHGLDAEARPQNGILPDGVAEAQPDVDAIPGVVVGKPLVHGGRNRVLSPIGPRNGRKREGRDERRRRNGRHEPGSEPPENEDQDGGGETQHGSPAFRARDRKGGKGGQPDCRDSARAAASQEERGGDRQEHHERQHRAG